MLVLRSSHRFPIALIAAVLISGLAFFAQAEENKWAVIAGNNLGGQGRIPLRFAEEDAQRVARVLTGLARFDHDRVHLLLGGTPEAFLREVRRAALGAGRSGHLQGSFLFVFYSGHADGENLLMGDHKLAMSELKRVAQETDAHVALVVLDACNSGAAILEKGGRSAPSFLRFNDSPRAKGRIILTSAAASELAQESDDIGSSFFTHYLVSGLMGDADRSGDRKVTLSELYRYVYDRTVHRTVDTLPGVQHPAFSYKLEGEGSIVLTDLNSESTGVFLPADSEGNYLLFDQGRRSVVAELDKRRGERRLIPLSPGRYLLKKRQKENLLSTEVEIETGHRVTISDATMQEVEFEYPTAKGWDLALRSKPRKWEAQALAGWTAFSRAPAGGIWSFPTVGVAMRLRGWPAPRWNARLAVTGGGWEHALPVEDRRMDFVLMQIGADFSLGYVMEYGPYAVEFGGRAGFTFLQRRFDEGGYTGTDQATGGGLGPYALASVQLGMVRIALELSGGMFLFPTADNMVVPYVSGGVAVGFGI